MYYSAGKGLDVRVLKIQISLENQLEEFDWKTTSRIVTDPSFSPLNQLKDKIQVAQLVVLLEGKCNQFEFVILLQTQFQLNYKY